MRDAPYVMSQQTFYKTYYKLPVSMFTCVKRQPVVIYNIKGDQKYSIAPCRLNCYIYVAPFTIQTRLVMK